MKAIKYVLAFAALQLVTTYANAQENAVVFTYDKGGNMVQRKIQVMLTGRLGNFSTPADSIVAPPGFKVYPNPASQALYLEGELPAGIGQVDVRLLTITGQLLKTEVYTGQLKAMDIGSLKNGIYLLEVKYSKKQRSTYKIIISN